MCVLMGMHQPSCPFLPRWGLSGPSGKKNHSANETQAGRFSLGVLESGHTSSYSLKGGLFSSSLSLLGISAELVMGPFRVTTSAEALALNLTLKGGKRLKLVMWKVGLGATDRIERKDEARQREETSGIPRHSSLPLTPRDMVVQWEVPEL